jgi:hypothetical protein
MIFSGVAAILVDIIQLSWDASVFGDDVRDCTLDEARIVRKR